MGHLSIFLLATVIAGSALAQHEHGAAPVAASSWTQQPLLLPAGKRGEREAAQVRVVGIAVDTLAVHAPDAQVGALPSEFPLEEDVAAIAPASPKVGNYHWLVAREETPASVKVATTAWYFGNPGPSPKALLARPKHELEIVPDPLPREHGSYRESEKWRFVVRQGGKPLAGQALLLETEFGSRSRFVTDQDGIATVLFPRDFQPLPKDKAEHGRPSARFVLSTESQVGERRYLTAFNANYGPDAERGRSLAWGAGFCLAGMLAATPLLRRRVAGEAKERSDA